MKVKLNSLPSESLTRRDSLLAAEKRLGIDVFGDEEDYILNIQPCEIKMGKKWTGLWHIDVLLDSKFPEVYSDMDLVFQSSSNALQPYGQILFQALDPVLHRRMPDIRQEFDFVSCGTLGYPFHEKRHEAIELLAKHFNYRDWGKGHSPEEYVKKYNTAKVQFIRSGEGREKKGALAQRFFECLGIGPVLVDWNNDLLLTGLVEGTDYLAYRNDEEMIDKMKLLIDNPDLREKIWHNGRQKALMNHTYEHRLISIINAISNFSA